MDRSARDFFYKILETPSPSGYEEPVQRIVREYAASFADEVDNRCSWKRDHPL